MRCCASIKKRSNVSSRWLAVEVVRQSINQLINQFKNQSITAPTGGAVSNQNMEEERAKLREEFEAQMQDMKREYEAEKGSKAKLQVEMETLKQEYMEAKTR